MSSKPQVKQCSQYLSPRMIMLSPVYKQNTHISRHRLLNTTVELTWGPWLAERIKVDYRDSRSVDPIVMLTSATGYKP